MGSNMAEAHPVGFQWVMEAKARGARVIHVDPRFTRTSALADQHVTVRAGTDIAFLGGVINYILANNLEFREYVQAYTNAPFLVNEQYQDTEDLDGLFSGYDPHAAAYDRSSWSYESVVAESASGARHKEQSSPYQSGSGGPVLEGAAGELAGDPSLEHPRCVFQILKRHFARYTPGDGRADLRRAPGPLPGGMPGLDGELRPGAHRGAGVQRGLDPALGRSAVHPGRSRSSSCCWATSAVPAAGSSRCAGTPASRAPPTSRPCSTCCPATCRCRMPRHEDLPGYLDEVRGHNNKGFWSNADTYMVSLLKEYWGDAATPENDFCFDYLPRINGDHGTYRTVMDMVDGKVSGYFLLGENPAVGSAHGRLQRLAWPTWTGWWSATWR